MGASFGSINYAVTTHQPSRNSALLGAGLDLVLSPSVLLYSDYSAQTGGGTRVLNEWRLGIAIGF